MDPLNDRQVIINNVYWALTIVSSAIIVLSCFKKWAIDMIFPANVVINMRQVFRMLDFENTKYDP